MPEGRLERTRQVYSQDGTCRCGNGNWRTMLTSALDTFRATGRVPKVINIGRDIHEHIAADTIERQRFWSDSISFKGVNLNYVPEMDFGAIEVK